MIYIEGYRVVKVPADPPVHEISLNTDKSNVAILSKIDLFISL